MSDQDAISGDTMALMQFQARKKSAGIAYLLWLFVDLFLIPGIVERYNTDLLRQFG